MSTRIGLYLERLTLDDLLFLESELERRKEKYRRQHVVMAVQSEQRLLTTLKRDKLAIIAKEMRRYVHECAVAGNGVVLAFSPESSLMLFRDVKSAAATAARLLTTLADLNGRLKAETSSIALKLGMATGSDVLAAGSMRSVRQSVLVKRAGHCAWKAPAGSMLMDEHCAQQWEPRNEALRLPMEVDGITIYRANPAATNNTATGADDDRLIAYLDAVVSKGISTLKYFLLREDTVDDAEAWTQSNGRAVITLEGFDPSTMKNLSFTTRCPLNDYANKVDAIRRLISDRGLGLVKHEESMPIIAA
ncbi:MAG: hypothetical protein IPK53_06655 [bacterium]|nr:hypothetical protein [bacterium]